MTNLRAEGSGVRAEREMCRSETASRGTKRAERAESRSRPHATQARRLERVKARGHALACPPPGGGQRSACCSVWSLASADSARLNKRLQTLLLAVLEEGEHLPGAAGRVGAPGLTRSSRRAWPSTMAGALAGLQRGGGRGGSRGGAARTKERTAAPRRILTRRSSNCCRTSFQSGVPSSLSSSLVPNSARFSSTSASARPCPWSTPWLASTCGRRGSVRVGRCSGGAQQRDESLFGGVGPRPLRGHVSTSIRRGGSAETLTSNPPQKEHIEREAGF